MKNEHLGEREIIEIIKNQLDMPKMPIPFGDDVSAYPMTNNKVLVLKTDMLVDKTDVPKGMSFWQAARKAVVMNVSDFASKGVEPKVILVSLGLPQKMAKKAVVEEIAKGLNAGAREYNAYVIGGDTNEASDLVISVSLFGTADKNTLMLRGGAKLGDVVAVTGKFGKTACGLKILLNGCKASSRISKAFVASVLMPQARLKEGLCLCQTRSVTAAIDSSDGLAWCLHEIARASNVGFLIDNPPIAEEVEKFAKVNHLDPLELALYGGEEYELVVTIKPKFWERTVRAIEKVGGQLLPIGKVVRERKVLLRKGKATLEVEPRGWEHFKL